MSLNSGPDIVRADTAAAPVNNHGVISYDIFSTNKWHEKTHFFISDDGYHALLLTQKYSFVYCKGRHSRCTCQ